MKLIITSTETNVTFQRSQTAVFAKNQVDFELHPACVSFMTTRETFEFKYADIQVNSVTLTTGNAKALLSAALFRNASGDGSGTGGDLETIRNDINQMIEEKFNNLQINIGEF